MKKLLLLFTLISLISCTTDDNKTSAETTIYGNKIKPAQLPLESNDMIVDVQLVTISD